MPHVITQSCVGDGSCVVSCPVNCIQPTPDDPAFELAEMLHIDPTSCMDCGACIEACPVDAIKPERQLTEAELPFVAINAAFHAGAERRERPVLAPVRPPLRVRRHGEPLHVAIIGSGPAAMYAADEILTIPGARVSVYERLALPYGLVRSGVAPDHRRTRRVTRQLEQIRSQPAGLTVHLGVEVGRDVTIDGLLRGHHAVIHAGGAASDRVLDIPGAQLPGVASAMSFVGWYNGHPDHQDHQFDLSHEQAVVIGNGNVALDIARILSCDPSTLEDTTIAPAALAALRESRIREVVVVGRRGPEHSAFTLPELVGLSSAGGVPVTVDPSVLADLPMGDAKLDLLRELPAQADGRRHIALRYGLSPTAMLGDDHVRAVEFVPTFGDDPAAREAISAGLVVTSIGYRGKPVGDLPFDPATDTVPNRDGRVIDPELKITVEGLYVAGWIKRGPRGFIGTNKVCSQDTVAALVDDYNAGLLRSAPPPARPRRRPHLRALAR